MKNENWKNKIFNLHFPICNFKYNCIAIGGVMEAQAHRSGGTGASPVLATHAYQARAGASIDA
ncbi:MAG: hypothetical protein COS94_05910 [Candidatus Hydrogenedentes bacterium CG07_land_8_20_14_0_80_42_17]|nr:MAG: hypothetical protein COS94_05910 [Candidatus Hydrogenedentes bacterium CG07_land_8_20_14_0_80_42_17]